MRIVDGYRIIKGRSHHEHGYKYIIGERISHENPKRKTKVNTSKKGLANIEVLP